MCFNADKSKIFTFPSDAGRIMQIDLASGEIVKVAGTGVNHNKNTYTDGTPGNPMTATLGQCDGAVCGADGTIYFSEGASGKTIRMFVPDINGDYSKGTIRTIAGKPYDSTVLNYPNGLAFAADGKTLYFVDNGAKVGKVYYQKYE
jgi:sugar lactone lactonase YvrE